MYRDPIAAPNHSFKKETKIMYNAGITPMHTVLNLLRQDRKVEAVKEFRAAYKTDLRQAIDAVEAIRDVYLPSGATDFIVVSRYDGHDDYQVSHVNSKEEAMNDANRIVHVREDVVVASIIARSIITRAMQEV
jgi:hypothetical protein